MSAGELDQRVLAGRDAMRRFDVDRTRYGEHVRWMDHAVRLHAALASLLDFVDALQAQNALSLLGDPGARSMTPMSRDARPGPQPTPIPKRDGR
jgi:hypothetical protein